jgi:hypothetical protein
MRNEEMKKAERSRQMSRVAAEDERVISDFVVHNAIPVGGVKWKVEEGMDDFRFSVMAVMDLVGEVENKKELEKLLLNYTKKILRMIVEGD